MKTHMLPLLTLLAVPALAEDHWSLGLGANFKESNSFTRTNGGRPNTFRHRATVAPSLILGYKALDFGAGDLTATLEYQFPTQYTASAPAKGLPDFSYRMEYLAPGVQWNHHVSDAFDLGLGAHLRWTNLKSAATGVNAQTRQPWLDAHARYTFQDAGTVRPFAGLRVARVLASTPGEPNLQGYARNPSGTLRQGMKRLDNIWEASIQAGIRF
jgi:hypothetical protein